MDDYISNLPIIYGNTDGLNRFISALYGDEDGLCLPSIVQGDTNVSAYLAGLSITLHMNQYWADDDPLKSMTIKNYQEAFRNHIKNVLDEVQPALVNVEAEGFGMPLEVNFIGIAGNTCTIQFGLGCLIPENLDFFHSQMEAQRIVNDCAKKVIPKLEEFGAKLIEYHIDA